MNPKFFIVVAAVAIVVSALIAAAPYLVPSSACQKWLNENIGKRLGAKVAVKKIKLRSFPSLGFSIDGLEIVSANAPFQGLSIAKAERISGDLSLTGLLDGRVITSAKASDLVVDLRFFGGETNLAAAIGSQGTAEEGAAPSPPAIPGTLPPSGGGPQVPVFKALPAEPGAPPPDVNTAPSGAPEDAPPEKPAGPQSFLNDILIRTADAEDKIAAGEVQKGDGNIEIKSLEVSGGRINIWLDNVRQMAVEEIELSSKRLKFSNGTGAGFEIKGALIDLLHTSAAGETLKTNLGAAGQILVDRTAQSVLVKDMSLGIAGSHITIDSSVGYKPWFGQFYFHAVSANLSREASLPLFAFLPEWLSNNLVWQGNLSLDILAKGAKEGFEISAGSDLSLAKLSFGKFFIKSSGLPLKAAFALIVSPDSIAMDRGDLTLGESAFKTAGSMTRGDIPSVKLNIQADGLNDTPLRTYFPWLAFLDSINGLKLSVDAEGEIVAEAPMKISGLFGAAGLKVAGIQLSDVEGSFDHMAIPPPEIETPQAPPAAAKHAISFPTLKATFMGGAVSGNGTASLGDTVDLSFDAVVDRVDASNIPAIGGAISGSSSLVIKAAASGQNAEELAKDLSLDGTLVLKSAVWSRTDPVLNLFAPATWEAIEGLSGVKFSGPARKKLAESNSNIGDMTASFGMSEGTIKISPVSWKNPNYDASAEGEIDAARGVVAAGQIVVPRETATLLVPAVAQKFLLDQKGRLSLPVNFSGRPSEIAAVFDQTKFEAVIKSQAAKPIKPEVEKRPAKETATPATGALSRKGGQPAQRNASPEAGQKAPASKIPEQSEEDILKVIIGE